MNPHQVGRLVTIMMLSVSAAAAFAGCQDFSGSWRAQDPSRSCRCPCCNERFYEIAHVHNN